MAKAAQIPAQRAPNRTRTDTGRILRQLLLLISTGTLGINSRNLLD